MKYLSALSATLALASFSMSVNAADLGGTMKDDYAPIAHDTPFAGPYIGAYGGWGGASFKGVIDSEEIINDTSEDAEVFSGDQKTGGVYGGYIGYNVVRSDWLFGLELDAGSGHMSSFTQDDDGDDNAKQELNWMGSARARLGMLIDDRSLIYVTGGIGYLSTQVTLHNDLFDDNAESGKIDVSSFGFIGGLGYEHMFTPHLGLRLEGLYFMPSDTYSFRQEELTRDVDNGDFVEVEGVYQIRGGLTYHF